MARWLQVFYGLAGSVLAISLVVQASIFSNANAAPVTTTLRPISTGTFNAWSAVGTADGTCSGLCDYVDEESADGDASYLHGANVAAASIIFGLGDTGTSGQTATSITVRVTARSGTTSGLGYPPLTISLTIGGSTLSASPVTFNSNVYQVHSAVFSGSWTKSQVDAATVTILKGSNVLQPGVFVTQVYADVSYQRPALAQGNYRVYENQNSATPGAALGETNAVVETPKDVPFRLRLGISPTDTNWEMGAWGPHDNLYKLQYAQLTAASCSAQASGWTDVTAGSGAIRWYDNSAASSGAGLTDLGANDVSAAGSRVMLSYQEENNFTNSAAVTVGNTGIWDFSLVSAGQPAGRSYCFKVINDDGTQLDAYNHYPKVTLTGDLDIGLVDADGSNVSSPVVPFSSTITTTTGCNVTTATLGVPSQKIRVSNALVTNGWSVSIAAEHPTDLWSTGASLYDFNDTATCNDGTDSDAWAGQLELDFSGSTITPATGCSNTGISSGSSDSFKEGTVDAITLLSATSNSERFCYWDLTGINLRQHVPSQTAPGSYDLGMVITVLAQ